MRRQVVVAGVDGSSSTLLPVHGCQMMLVSILLRFTRRAAAGAQALRLQRAPSRTVEMQPQERS